MKKYIFVLFWTINLYALPSFSLPSTPPSVPERVAFVIKAQVRAAMIPNIPGLRGAPAGEAAQVATQKLIDATHEALKEGPFHRTLANLIGNVDPESVRIVVQRFLAQQEPLITNSLADMIGQTSPTSVGGLNKINLVSLTTSIDSVSETLSRALLTDLTEIWEERMARFTARAAGLAKRAIGGPVAGAALTFAIHAATSPKETLGATEAGSAPHKGRFREALTATGKSLAALDLLEWVTAQQDKLTLVISCADLKYRAEHLEACNQLREDSAPQTSQVASHSAAADRHEPTTTKDSLPQPANAITVSRGSSR